MFYLQENHIFLTKGDTAYLTISLKNADGTTYEPQDGDALRFAMKTSYATPICSINKQLDMTNLQLTLLPSDTKRLKSREYVYDIELTDSNGRVTTVISDKMTLLEEVC